MRISMAEVLNRLVAEKLATPESIARARAALRSAAEQSTPWFVTAFAGFGAWVATMMMLGFLSFAIVDSSAGALIIGVACIAGAIKLRRNAPAEFLRQLALALSLAGQGLVMFGVGAEGKSVVGAAFAGLVLSVALIPLFPDRVHRFLSALLGLASIAVLVSEAHARTLGDFYLLGLLAGIALVWRVGARDRDAALGEMLAPVGYALLVALLVTLGMSTAVRMSEFGGLGYWRLGALSSLGLTAAVLALEHGILEELADRGTEHDREIVIGAVAGTLALAVLTWSTPGIMAALGVLLLGFDRRSPVVVGLGALFVLGFGAVYYYSMDLSLLDKSLVLMTSGGLLLFGRWFLVSRMTPPAAGGAS